jgi:hypothetical protein
MMSFTIHRSFLRPAVLVAGLGLLGLLAPAASARVNSVGLIDFTKKNFKMGDWVRYRIESSNSLGHEDVSYQEVRIVGEEVFRGEKCFWVETLYGPELKTAAVDLGLVSEDGFKEPNPDVHFSFYLRKTLFGYDAEGVPDILELRRSDPTRPLPDLTHLRGEVDTLGTDTLETAKGSLVARLIQIHRKINNPRTTPDSTVNQISETFRKDWVSRKVPITSLVREEETLQKKVQAYKLGTVSTGVPESVIETHTKVVQMIDWGTGAKSELLEDYRKKKGTVKVPVSNAGD